MSPQFILAVALGGAVGSVARYLVGIGSGKLFGFDFPWGTLIINVTGSLLIGAFIGLFATRWDLSQLMRLFLTVGICGGYTTFSSYAFETMAFLEGGQWMLVTTNFLANNLLSCLAALAGMALARVL